MRIPKNIVLVQLEKKSETEYVFGNGHTIHLMVELDAYKDGTYNPNNYVRIYGEVIAIPDRLGKGGKDESEPVVWFNDSPKYIDSIVEEVKKGDRIYFYYTQISEHNLLEWDGKIYYKVPYTQIICSIRNGEIIMIGGHTLLTPYYGGDIVEETIGGHKVFGTKTSFGIFLPVDKPEERKGIVEHVGTPLIEDECNISVGDLVLFPANYDVRNTIEGKEYYTMRQHEILAILCENQL